MERPAYIFWNAYHLACILYFAGTWGTLFQGGYMVGKEKKSEGPLRVVGCSGCTHDGQLAHLLAMGVVEDEFASPLCLSAIGAGYTQDTTEAQHAEGIIIIDGCSKACARKILEKAVGRPMLHACVLEEMGIPEEGCLGKNTPVFMDLKRKIKIRYAQNRMLMSSMGACGCVRG